MEYVRKNSTGWAGPGTPPYPKKGMIAMEGVTYSKIREAEQRVVVEAVAWRKVAKRYDEELRTNSDDVFMWTRVYAHAYRGFCAAVDDLISLTEEANDV